MSTSSRRVAWLGLGSAGSRRVAAGAGACGRRSCPCCSGADSEQTVVRRVRGGLPGGTPCRSPPPGLLGDTGSAVWLALWVPSSCPGTGRAATAPDTPLLMASLWMGGAAGFRYLSHHKLQETQSRLRAGRLQGEMRLLREGVTAWRGRGGGNPHSGRAGGP